MTFLADRVKFLYQLKGNTRYWVLSLSETSFSVLTLPSSDIDQDWEGGSMITWLYYRNDKSTAPECGRRERTVFGEAGHLVYKRSVSAIHPDSSTTCFQPFANELQAPTLGFLWRIPSDTHISSGCTGSGWQEAKRTHCSYYPPDPVQFLPVRGELGPMNTIVPGCSFSMPSRHINCLADAGHTRTIPKLGVEHRGCD